MRKRKGIGLVVLTAILLLSGCQNLPGTEETVPAKGQESQEEMPTEMDLPIETQEKPVMESMPAEPAAGQEPEAGEEASGQQAFKEENQEKGLPEKEEKPAEEASAEPPEESLPEEIPPAEEQAGQQAEPPDEAAEQRGIMVEEKTLVIPGLEREYRYLFLSDTHIISLDGEESEQQLENALPRRDTLFKDELGRTPEEVFPDWIAYANEQQVDGLLLGGDVIDFPSQGNLSFLEKNLEMLEMPYLYVPGNHDWTYPWEYMTDKGRQEYLAALSPWMRGTPAAQVMENEELVFLGVDNSSNQIDPAAMDTVRSAMERGKPVIILQHVPFATDRLVDTAAGLWKNPVLLGKGVLGGIYPNEASQEYMNLVLGGGSPVKAVLAGHIHIGEQDSLTEGIVQYTAEAGYMGKGLLLIIKGEEQADTQSD